MKKDRWVSATAGAAMVAAMFALPGVGVAHASGGGNGNTLGSGNGSLLSGNSVSPPISAPVNLCGLSAAGGGFADSHCHGGASTQLTGPAGGSGGNGNTVGNGNASNVSGNTISVPVNA